MPVVCFRCIGTPAGRGQGAPGSTTPATSEVDKWNSEIVERINASARAYLTQTKLRGRTVMRIGLGNILTTEEHVRKGWELIRETASAL
jgi:glutamate/tyrosine decarboxylase-like PLP-dependent enzyme